MLSEYQIDQNVEKRGQQLQLLGVPFIVCLRSTAYDTVASPSAGASRDSCRSQGHHKRDTRTISAFACRGWEGP